MHVLRRTGARIKVTKAVDARGKTEPFADLAKAMSPPPPEKKKSEKEAKKNGEKEDAKRK